MSKREQIRTRARRSLLSVAVSVGMLLTACGDSPEALVASAKSYLAKNDRKAAVIELKNALQKRHDFGEARFLLGRTLLDSGDPQSALVELHKALDFRYPETVVLPVLARAMLALGKHKALTDTYAATELAEPAANADLQSTVALAYLAQGQPAKAQSAVDAALAKAPGHVPAIVVQARIKAATRDLDGSIALLDRTLTSAPDSYDAWLVKGDLLTYGKRDATAGLAAYRKALALRTDSVQAHAAVIRSLMATNDVDGAAKQVDALRSFAAGHPLTRYFEALLALNRRDYKAAREIGQQLAKVAPDDPQVLQLMGALDLEARSFLQAETKLNKSMRLAPNVPLTRKLLAQAYLQLGQPDRVLSTLAPLTESGEADAAMLSIAGQAHLHKGDLEQAEALFERAAKKDPADARSRTSLALTRLAMGAKPDEIVSELESIASADSGTATDLVVITTQVRRKDYPGAMKSIDKLEKKQPKSPLPPHLRGQVQQAMKEFGAARQSFEQALTRDASYFPAAQRLAMLDIADKKPQQALKRYEAVLDARPNDLQAMLALAQLKALQGASKEEVTAMLNQAVASHPNEEGPRLSLVDYQLRQRDFRSAVTTAQQALVVLPDNPLLLEALGRAQAATGDVNQALAAFGKLATVRPNAVESYILLAEAQAHAKRMDEALQTARRGIELNPTSLPAHRQFIAIALNSGKPAEALADVREVQKRFPGNPVALVFEGDVNVLTKDFPAAAQAYRAALKKVKASPVAVKLHGALVASKSPAEAERFAASWLSENPRDTAFLFYLGTTALSRSENERAEKYLAKVVELKPEDVPALNNLAWAMLAQKKPGALTYAQKANDLSPNQPALMGTLSKALAENGRLPLALDVQRKIVDLQPRNLLARLSLAKLYLQAGEQSRAKAELLELSKAGEKFSGQSEVSELLRNL